MKSGLFAFLLAVSLVLILTGPLVAQTTTDLSSVPSKSQKACRERAAKEFRVKTKDIRITGLRLDRSAFRTLYLENKRSGETATCEVNPSNASVVSLTRTPAGSSGEQSGQETVLEFQTQTYRARAYRLASGTTFLEIYNKGTGRSVLNNPAVNNAGAGFTEYIACTTNRTPCDGTQYTARMENSGKKSLNIKQHQNSKGVTESAIRESTGEPGLVDKWMGQWSGPEGTYLLLSKRGDKYVVKIRSLDGLQTYEGNAAGDRIEFTRNGKTESIHAGSGQDTGMKWLLEKKRCLTIKTGEGFCRE